MPKERPPRTGRDPERYEPLPGVTGLPAFVWRRLPRPARMVVALLPVAAVALAIVLAPGIQSAKEERERAEERREARAEAQRIARLRAEQRPRLGVSATALPDTAPAARRLAARDAVLADVSTAVERDARARVARGELRGPIRHVSCGEFPRTADDRRPEDDLSRRRGRYACLAVTAVARPGEATVGLRIGHPYRVLVDFESGRYGLCKISGRAGEGGLTARQRITVPEVCGGR